MFKPDTRRMPSTRQWLVAVIGLIVLLGLGLQHIHGMLHAQARDAAEQQLYSVASLKSGEIQHWLNNHLILLSQPPAGVMARAFDDLLNSRKTASAARQLQARARYLQATIPEIGSVVLYDLDGEFRWGSHAGHAPLDAADRDAMRKTREERQSVFVDIHQAGAANDEFMVEILAPLFAGQEENAPVIGYALFEISPKLELHTIVGHWPVPSQTAESLIARPAGSEVVFLSPRRHPAAASSRRLSVDTPELITAKALRGEGEVLSGVDYRGEPVLGVVLKIPETDWLLVAKMDDREIFQDARRNFLWIGTGSLILLAMLLALGRAYFAAQQARAHEAHFRLLAESGSDMVWLYELATGRFTYVSPSVEKMCGYTVAEALQQTMRDALTPESCAMIEAELPKWIASFTAGGETLRTRHFELSQPHKDGSTVLTEAVATLITDARGQVTHIQGISRDITQQKRDAAQLYKLSLAAEQSPASIVITNLEAKIEYVNEAFVRATGYSREEALGQNPRILQSGRTPAGSYTEMWANLSQGLPWHGELYNRHKDGAEYLEIASINPIHQTDGRITHYLAVKENISERRRIERALAESEEKFRTIYETINDAIFVHDLETGRILDVNSSASRLFGYSREQLLALDLTTITADTAPYTRELAQERIRLAKEEKWQAFEWLARDSTGRLFWVAVNLQSMTVGGQQQALAVVRDIDHRKRTEEQLRIALQVIEASPSVSFRWRAEENWPVEHVSANVSRWGYRPDDFRSGQTRYADLIHPDDLPRVGEEVTAHTAAKEDEYTQEYRLRAAGGEYFWITNHTHITRGENGQPLFYEGIVSDIDAKKRAELHLIEALAAKDALNRKLETASSQLLQSEKMASIGQLAAGVAHEINNPIGFVTSNLNTLERYLEDIFAIATAYELTEVGLGEQGSRFDAVRALKQSSDFDYLKSDIVQLMVESKDGLARVAKIVHDLKDFSRAGDAAFEWSDLHRGLDSTLNIVWNELKYKCTVQKEYGELPPIWCVPSQLNQVFMNLLVNAAHAIPEKGEITLRTGHVGDEVFIAVADSGCGIAPEHLNRVFEPFFTTKPVGKGTGLGLSLAYSIVQKHQGRFDVKSELGRGTTFTVWLPIEAMEAPDIEDSKGE